MKTDLILVNNDIMKNLFKKKLIHIDDMRTCANCKYCAYYNDGSPLCGNNFEHICYNSNFQFWQPLG